MSITHSTTPDASFSPEGRAAWQADHVGTLPAGSVTGLGTLATQNGTFSGTSSGTNTGDQTSIVGITGTMAQFDTAVTDGNFVYQSQALGTPLSGTATNLTGLPLSTGITGFGTGVATALAVNVGSAGAPVLFNGAGGTPSSLTGTNITGTAAGLTAGNATLAATVTTNANLTGPITSTGNATAVAAQTGTGSVFAMQASPTFTGTLAAAAITATGETITGDLTLSGNARRIIGDFSNVTLVNRAYVQSSTTNGATDLGLIPNGGGTGVSFRTFDNSTPTNAGNFNFGIDGTSAYLESRVTGSGTLKPLDIYMGALIAGRVSTLGRWYIGASTNATAMLHLSAGTATANTAPLKFTSGTLLTTAEAGAVEFLTDAYYGTITTGAARKTFAFLEAPAFTSGTFSSTLGVRALSTLTDGTDGTNTSGYKWVSFVSNSAECGNVIRVAQTSAVVFTTSSSRELKNLRGDSNLDAAAERIMAYRMREYDWKSQPGTLFNGPIAEEIYAVNPDPMLFPGGDKSINMSGFIPDLIMTAQRNETRLATLEARLRS